MAEHPLMTAREVAELFRVDVKTVYSWVKNGKLGNVATPTGGVRIRADEVRVLFEQEADPQDPDLGKSSQVKYHP
jgi:excisionase family DNA binding protein